MGGTDLSSFLWLFMFNKCILIKSIHAHSWQAYCVMIFKGGVLVGTRAAEQYLNFRIVIEFEEVRNAVWITVRASSTSLEGKLDRIFIFYLYLKCDRFVLLAFGPKDSRHLQVVFALFESFLPNLLGLVNTPTRNFLMKILLTIFKRIHHFSNLFDLREKFLLIFLYLYFFHLNHFIKRRQKIKIHFHFQGQVLDISSTNLQ